jgi:hypothetical protein
MKQNLTFTTQEDLCKYLRSQAQKCKAHSEDIELDLVTISDLTELVSKAKPGRTIYILEGFRDMGVDHTHFIQCRFENKGCYLPEKEYREIDEIRLEKKSDKVYYYVTRLFKNRYDTVERGLKANKYYDE